MANQKRVRTNKAQKRFLNVTQWWAGTFHIIFTDAWESTQGEAVAF